MSKKRRIAWGCSAFLAIVSVVGWSQFDATDRVDFGRQWKSWSNQTRLVYMAGFVDGGSATYLAVFNDLSSERREALRKATAVMYDSEAIADVMTDLYKDPANTFIRHDAMVYIARDKLDGNDIEGRLRYARQREYGLRRLPR